MRLLLSCVLPGGAEVDVIAEADAEATAGHFAAALAAAVGLPIGPLHVGGRSLADTAGLVEGGLTDGARVALQAGPHRGASPAGGRVTLQLVGGPSAGANLLLPMGTTDIGGGPRGVLHGDPDIPPEAVELIVSAAGVVVRPQHSAVRVDGVAVEGAVPLAPGQMLSLGNSRLSLATTPLRPAAVEPDAPGLLAFVRPPRLLFASPVVRVAFPAAPHERTRARMSTATVLAPLLLGVLMAVVTRRPLYLLMALASPLIALVTVAGERRASRRDLRRRQHDYTASSRLAAEKLSAALQAEGLRRRAAFPDPAAVLTAASLPGVRLWERRRTDPDFLLLRLGTAPMTSEVLVSTEGSSDPPDQPCVPDLPVTLSLGAAGVVGLTGPDHALQGLLRWLVLQLVVLHGPRDLQLTVLTVPSRSTWSFVRWLPHARPVDRYGPLVRIGNDEETVTARVAELSALVAARSASPSSVDPSAHVLVIDGYRELRATAGLSALLVDGPAVGVHVLCADLEERFLPEAAQATVAIDGESGTRLSLRCAGQLPVAGVLVDRVSPELASTAARALAPLRQVDREDPAVLPDAVRLLDLLDLSVPTAAAVRARWAACGRTTSCVVGVGADGPFRLDLERDGPHALIAGTTGSGKSELLQTLIASLAVANRPDALNFVLIDYKGGSAFRECVALPHTVGMVTDLDAHLVERALTSLTAELRLREERLAAAGARDITAYVELRTQHPHLAPMPALLLVIDEFASLTRELPVFVQGLVGIAQRGRSLGLSLLLATQRPSGVVSPEIRANTNLRIALRVTDAAESSDIVGAGNAATIATSTPGRAVARIGNTPLVLFQAARVGGRRRVGSASPLPSVTVRPWSKLGYPTQPSALSPTAQQDVETDLSLLVQALRTAAQQEAIPSQSSPWLPSLPAALLLDELGLPEPPGAVTPVCAWGRLDLPALQRQEAMTYSPGRDGHLLVVGSPGSGRSQVLRTLAGSLARSASAGDVHLYGLDCGNGALLAVGQLPHCGAVVSRTEPERAARLLDRLAAEVLRRQAVFAAGGFASMVEQRRSAPAGERLPHLVLLLDRWEGFTPGLGELEGGRLTECVVGLLREGASVGVTAVITGDRTLGAGRLSSLADSRIVLRLHERTDYALLGLSPRSLPERIPPGRAFLPPHGTEVQVALLTDDASGQAQSAALVDIAVATRARDVGVPTARRPFRIDALPTRVTVAEACALQTHPRTGRAVAGVGGDDVAAHGPDLSGGGSFVVAGPGRSGRSTALVAIATSLLASGSQVLVGAPRPSPLRELRHPRLLPVVVDAFASEDAWRALLAAGGREPVVLILDDAELLRDAPAAAVFRDVVTGSLGPHRSLVLGGAADGLCLGLSGWQVEVRKARRGLLLSPQSAGDGELIGVRLPRGATGRPVQPGDGLLHLGDGRLLRVRVPCG